MHAISILVNGEIILVKRQFKGEKPVDLAFDQMAAVIGSAFDVNGDAVEPKGRAILERVIFPWGEMWCDEEGLLQHKPVVNRPATELMQNHYGYGHIVGTVVLRIKKGYELVYSEANIMEGLRVEKIAKKKAV